MNFTREPMIETVITPKDGCKLCVKNSKVEGAEEYLVEALEVVSFGQALFFRSTERPKSFLIPVTDYEVSELKEVRMPLKTGGNTSSIRIGGGREAPLRSATKEEPLSAEEEAPPSSDPPQERFEKRGRRSRHRRRPAPESRSEPPPPPSEEGLEEGTAEKETLPAGEPAVSPSFISRLFPPPSTLIKETLSRYKISDEVIVDDSIPKEVLEPMPSAEEQLHDREEDSDF